VRRVTRRAGAVGALALVPLLLAFGPTADAQARRFYVDPAGDNRSSGLSPARAWRTVGRVNRASLRPGDHILLRGRREHRDAALSPRASGSRGRRIRYASFGGGRANLTQGVFLASVAWITIEGLRIRGAPQGIAGSVQGSGARDILLRDNAISGVQIGINSPSAADRRWRIVGNRITRTGDSGMIVQGASFAVIRNTVMRTGLDPTIAYAKHGIYAKGPDLRIRDNRISAFSTEGISTRYRNAVISDNVIDEGQGGIGYYRDDPVPGTTVICGNVIGRVGYGIYISPQGSAGVTEERFRILRNVIGAPDGQWIAVSADRERVETSGNRLERATGTVAAPRRPTGCPPRQPTDSGD
jgi:hypothetical protein